MIAFEPNNFPPKWVGGQKADNRIDQQRRQLGDAELSISPTFPWIQSIGLKLKTRESEHD